MAATDRRGRSNRSTVLCPVDTPRPATVVLSGGPSYLSGALARRLVDDGERVVVLTAGPVVAPADRCGPELVEHHPEDPAVPDGLAHGVDVVLHVAAGPQEQSLRGLSTTGLETLFALRLARSNGARLVIASLPGNADHLHADEAMAAGYRASHDVDTVVARVAECYGPGMPLDEGLPARLLAEACRTGVVRADGLGARPQRLCFVDDVVAGLLLLARTGCEGPVLLGPPLPTGPRELVEAVAAATGAHVAPIPADAALLAPGTPDPLPVDGSPPAGWAPTVPLVEGLRRCVGRLGATAAASATAAGAVGAGAVGGGAVVGSAVGGGAVGGGAVGGGAVVGTAVVGTAVVGTAAVGTAVVGGTGTALGTVPVTEVTAEVDDGVA